MEQKLSKSGDKRYFRLSSDLTVHGYTRKDGTKTPDQFFPKGSFVNLIEKPTELEIIEAGNKSEAAGAFLEKRAANWGGGYPESLLKEYEVQPPKDS